MGTTALSIKGKTSSGDGITSTINYVNPNATAAQLVSLATAMNNLTTNTVSDITRIDKNSLTGISPKQSRDLKWKDTGTTETTLQQSEISTSLADLTSTLEITSLSANEMPIIENNSPIFISITQGSFATEYIVMLARYEGTSWTGSIKFTLPETEQYEASEITLTIT